MTVKNHIYLKDWKFWAKIILGCVIFLVWIVFIIGEGNDFIGGVNDPFIWSITTDPNGKPIVNGGSVELSYLQEAMNWSTAQKVWALICRNTFFITTMVNISLAIFWINSARNHMNEGKGKFDNSKYGIMLMVAMTWVIINYLMSYLFSDNAEQMQWYTWVSLFGEHSVWPLCSVIYFLVFYNHKLFDFSKKHMKKNFFWSTVMIDGYFVLFMIIGLIGRAANMQAPFGELSHDGYFPYIFLDVAWPHSTVADAIPMWVQFVFMVVFSFGFCSGFYFLYRIIIKGVVKQHEKRENKSEPLKENISVQE